tara:strand:+ start:1286 stop:1858 length:573 start_codon:yes stop_codon:yes gene_type:complete
MPSAVIAITGASGSQYSVRLIEALVDADWDIFLTVTREGAINLKLECGITPRELAEKHGIRLEQNQNLAAKSASGSARFDAYVICPASGTTIGKIAAGISDNLATRSAIVAMKERRKLIIVPRETPMATPHLEALAKLSSWGVVVLPASPGFYKNPETIDDLIDFVVARILDQLDVEHSVGSRWTGEEVS